MFFLFYLPLLIACNATKKVYNGDNSTVKLKKHSTEYLLKKLKSNELDAEWLSAKAKITYKDSEQTRKFTANIRLRKDSVLWMNFKKMSVEAARVLVTKDSIYILNRLDKEYYVKSLDYAQEQFNLPAKFQTLQTVLFGNPWFYEKQNLKGTIANQSYQLSSGDETRMLSDYFLNGLQYTLEKMAFFDLERDRKLKVSLENYLPLMDGRQFSHNRIFQIESEKTGTATIKIEFSKVELDVPKSIIFNISKRYKRVD